MLETSVLQQKLEPPGYQFPSPAGKDALSLDVCNATVSPKSDFPVICSGVAQTLYCCSLQWLQIAELL